MKQLNYSLLTLLLFLSCTAQQAVVEQELSIEVRLQQALDSIYAVHKDAVGLMLHVEAPDKHLSWSVAAGSGEKNSSEALDPKRPALIASNTKTYVSAAILKLVEAGNLTIDEPISGLISEQSERALIKDGYDTQAIQIKHLLSHTSGIIDYTTFDEFFNTTVERAPYRWTRDEQIALAMRLGEPLGGAGEQFSYSDTNYLLLTEVIEKKTGKPFFTAMRSLLDYEAMGLDETWFETLEDRPVDILPLVHQYVGAMGLDSYAIDVSFDLYGGGGIAATTEDLAQFAQALFAGEMFDNKEIRDLIFTEMPIVKAESQGYHFGLSRNDDIHGHIGYGHGGFWGTVVMYIPDMNTSIAVFVLERDKNALRGDILETVVRVLEEG
jgi:D-alanyl-D-alanine carboxypeptidase